MLRQSARGTKLVRGYGLAFAIVLAVAGLAPTAAVLADSVYVPDDRGDLNQPDLPPKTVVLTFDDGPSSYTPQILAVLQQKHVHATFFVIGDQAVQYQMLRRIYAAGNDLGNHTYTHPDLAKQPWWRLLLELNFTRIIIGSQTGHSTRLFRPPYLGTDAPPIDAYGVMTEAGNLGYISVASNIDSNDWRRPGTPTIVAQAENPSGGLILLHDGGGDRRQTVAALPSIIDYYTQRGFHFYTVSQALSQSRDQLMPRLAPVDQAVAALALAFFTLWAWVGASIHWLIIVIIVASFARAVIVVAAALLQSRRRGTSHPESGPSPSCTVVIPAWNESTVIQSCLKSVLNTGYTHLEVIVVDDGSVDDTAHKARSITDPRLRVLSKNPRGGKARALNHGIRHSRGEIIIAIDSDTVFRPDTIPLLVRHFTASRVGAVSGNTKIVNRHKLLTKLQSLEYIVGFNLDRRMGDLFDCITVVPGAIGAFRRSALYQVNGFASDTLAEDTDLTLAIKETGATIVYDDQAIAYTEAPATVHDLMKQRFRWTFGTMQAVYKHRRSILNPQAGALGLIGLPYLLVFQIIFPLISPLFDLAMLAGLLLHQYHLIVVSFVVYSALDTVTSAIALKLDHEPLSQLWILAPQRVFYRQLMYYVIARSALNVAKGKLVRWGGVKREGLHLAENTKLPA